MSEQPFPEEQWMTGTIGFKVGGIPVQMDMTIPANPVHPRRMLPVFRQMTHAFVDMGVENDLAEGRSVSCKAGCGACCRQLVPISEIEARELNDLVEAMPAERRTTIKNRFAAALEKLEQAGMLEILREPENFYNTTVKEIGINYFQLGIPCPFLEEESCSIHPDRPLACREYLVTSPAENCVSPTADKINQTTLPAKVSNAVVLLSQVKEGARFIPYVPMILALDFAQNTPDEMTAESGESILKKVFSNLK
jgi:Fe-S-cluster containining protein